MTDEQLTAIFEKIHSQHFSKNNKKIKATFHPYRSLRHTIEWNHKYIHFKVSQYLAGAPENILQNLAIILSAKMYRVKLEKSIKDSYKAFANSIQPDIPKRKKSIPKGYKVQGKYYDLLDLFNNLNNKYFDNELEVKYLGWSKHKSFTRLGYYDKERDLLVVSQIFDSKKVPQNVIEYLLYHEMLHIYIPTTSHNGRRRIHTSEFQQIEREFPDFNNIQNWIKKKRFRL